MEESSEEEEEEEALATAEAGVNEQAGGSGNLNLSNQSMEVRGGEDAAGKGDSGASSVASHAAEDGGQRGATEAELEPEAAAEVAVARKAIAALRLPPDAKAEPRASAELSASLSASVAEPSTPPLVSLEDSLRAEVACRPTHSDVYLGFYSHCPPHYAS
jgi:hypothetical protein